MARRRVERLGRLAFQVATWVQAEALQVPLIFASRHGDVARTEALLTTLAKNEPLSPTSFALSVHNAIGAQYSIIRQVRSNVSAVSNGLFTLEAAVIEAATQLPDAGEVVLVMYEASIPDWYVGDLDEPNSDFAFAWKMVPGSTLRLESGPPADGGLSALTHSLDVWRFFLSEDRLLQRSDGLGGWTWSRQHG